ncbi:MAG: ComEC/Rec2 family competence protein [bacterium]
MKYKLLIIVFILLVVSVSLIYFDWQNSNKQFTFAMLDVGQGDALFIESPTGTQVLVDGGPPNKILGSLKKVMSPFDRSIDAVIITNPDEDHIGGLQDILKFYRVGKVFESGTWSDSKTYQNLEKEIENKKIPDILAKNGMRLDLGGGVVIDVLFPDRDVVDWPTNDGSVVARLSYGNMSFMLTGDASIMTEKLILENNQWSILKSDILKVSHHGSKNSTSEEFLKSIVPKFALISDGKNNKYGHPNQEVLNLLEKFKVKIFRTDEIGTIIIKCDNMEVCKIKK